MEEIIQKLDSEQRTSLPYHHIDPGFINQRKCFSAFGSSFAEEFMKNQNNDGSHWAKLYNDHLLVDLSLKRLKSVEAKNFGEILHNATEGELVCGTELLAGAGDKVFERNERVKNKLAFPFETDKDIVLEFSTRHFVADTGRSEQVESNRVSVIGQIREINSNKIIVHPIIMGAPSLDHPFNSDLNIDQTELAWMGFDFYEILPEDMDEFSSLKEVELSDQEEWKTYMKSASEKEIKQKICSILDDDPKKDWGGERNDHFTNHVNLNGERKSAAFLLKGPSKFREMTPEMLGKRADQIYRLSTSPADILCVQHCHDIGEAVQATLQAFAVEPHNPRHYCFIDGRTTYKILKSQELI